MRSVWRGVGLLGLVFGCNRQAQVLGTSADHGAAGALDAAAGHDASAPSDDSGMEVSDASTMTNSLVRDAGAAALPLQQDAAEASSPVLDKDKVQLFIVDGMHWIRAEDGAFVPGSRLSVELTNGDRLEVTADEAGGFRLRLEAFTGRSLRVYTSEEGETFFVLTLPAQVRCTAEDVEYLEFETASVDSVSCVCTDLGWGCAEGVGVLPDPCAVYETMQQCQEHGERCLVLEGRYQEEDTLTSKQMVRCNSVPETSCFDIEPTCFEHSVSGQRLLLENSCVSGPWVVADLEECFPAGSHLSLAAESTCDAHGLRYPPGVSFPRSQDGNTCFCSEYAGEATAACTNVGGSGGASGCYVAETLLGVGETLVEPLSCNACECVDEGEGPELRCAMSDCPRVAPVRCPEEILALPSWPVEQVRQEGQLFVLNALVPEGENADDFRLCHANTVEAGALEVRLMHIEGAGGELQERELEVNLWPLERFLESAEGLSSVQLRGLGFELTLTAK